jgi:hypothetical protein
MNDPRQTPDNRRGGEWDSLWLMGIAGLCVFGLWTATRDRLATAAAHRGLAWADEARNWHLAPLAYVSIVLLAAGVGGAVTVVGWASSARRWKAEQIGAIPRPPAVGAGLLIAGFGWTVALVLTGTSMTVFRITGPLALLAGGLAAHWVKMAGKRWVDTMVFNREATRVLGWAEPGLARVRTARWVSAQPGAIRATTGPGWRGGGGDLAALDRAATAVGWPGPYQWRVSAANAAVIGELSQ